MKRIARLFLTATIAAALVAASVHYVSARRANQVIAALHEPVTAVLQRLVTALGLASSLATANESESVGAVQSAPNRRTVLLSEPVIILGGGRSQLTTLVQGTQVALLQTDGQYARIRHQDRVLTIPRSATRAGIYRTN